MYCAIVAPKILGHGPPMYSSINILEINYSMSLSKLFSDDIIDWRYFAGDISSVRLWR